MTDKAAVLATFEEFKPVKTRKSVQIICEIPEERADAALAILGGYPQSGTSVWVGIARVDETVAQVTTEIADDETPEPATQERRKRDWDELDAREQSVLACKRADFQQWLCLKNGNEPSEDTAAWLVKAYCQVTSRRELPRSNRARGAWDHLWTSFQDAQQGRTDEDLREQARSGP